MIIIIFARNEDVRATTMHVQLQVSGMEDREGRVASSKSNGTRRNWGLNSQEIHTFNLSQSGQGIFTVLGRGHVGVLGGGSR